MPLSKKRNKERMRQSRATYVQPNSPVVVQPNPLDAVQPKLEAVGLKLDGNVVSLAGQPSVKRTTLPPIYDYNIHKPGDRVRVWQGNQLVEAVVPDGSGLESYSGGRLVSHNLLAPTFSPVPKPEPKVKKHKRFT